LKPSLAPRTLRAFQDCFNRSAHNLAMTPSSPSNAWRAAQAWDQLRRPIWIFDPHGLKGVYANPPALRLWGAESLAELLSRDFSGLSPAVKARTARLAEATGEGGQVSERWTFYPNGFPVTVEATISTFLLDDGRPVLLFEASEAEVGAGERRAVEALRHATSLITLFDDEGRAIFANPAAFAAYGTQDHPFAARYAVAEEASDIWASVAAGQAVSRVVQTATLHGDRWHHIDARQTLDPVTGGPGVLLNELDVTERVEAERARAAAEQRAAMAEARQRFLAEMSHELRTPLNAVIGFSELLEQSLETEQADRAGASTRRAIGWRRW
jgi:PAS domain-containing protein